MLIYKVLASAFRIKQNSGLCVTRRNCGAPHQRSWRAHRRSARRCCSSDPACRPAWNPHECDLTGGINNQRSITALGRRCLHFAAIFQRALQQYKESRCTLEDPAVLQRIPRYYSGSGGTTEDPAVLQRIPRYYRGSRGHGSTIIAMKASQCNRYQIKN